MQFFRIISFLSLILLLESCLKFESNEQGISDTNTKLNQGIPNTDKKKKFYKSPKKIVHDFSVRQEVKIPPQKVNDKSISHVILENEDGSFMMIVDREDLISKSTFNIPISRDGEKIEPKYVHVIK